VSLFVRLHPLLNVNPPQGVGTLVQHGNTVVVDLSLPVETLWSQTRRNHRQQIKQSIKAGYSASVDESWVHFEAFKAQYRSTMKHRSAAAYYFFEDGYFDRLRTALGDSIHLGVATVDDVVAASGLFVETNGIVQMHLTGHDDRFSAYQPMKLLFHHVGEWAKEHGHRLLHLGGGRGGCDDSLYHFKAGFSPLRRPFFSLRMVVREAEYRRLTSTTHPDLDPGDMTGSFPVYRR
jgi:lipid II:glycine glycyltransferase (peptidoglycan interpeptide bridge formation enzyme)